jgi:hypothetical protein
MTIPNLLAATGAALLTASLFVAAPAHAERGDHWPGSALDKPAPDIPGMPAELAKNLRNFDDLDFHVYSNQQWQNLHRSHAANIVVHYPDDQTTTGIPAHIAKLKFMWTFAPDNRITQHTIRFGTADGEWTAVMGYLDGTFTKPMDLGNGKIIQPTGKKYHLPMATLGHWNKQGTMSEEYLFWDNATLMQQIGAQ